MNQLLKTEYSTLPLRIPKPQMEFFNRTGHRLGISNNATILLALKFGGPILSSYVKAMEQGVHEQCRAITNKVRNSNERRNKTKYPAGK